ncbi:MAG: OmpA family protein [Roseivirga sp.]|nr:OmpA family protein [Roseivirga sp.]
MKKYCFFLLLGFISTFTLRAQDKKLTSTPPLSINKINTSDLEEAVPFITLDGKRIYFTRTNDQSSSVLKNKVLHEIWYANFSEGGQLEVKKAPKPLNAGLNSAVIGFNYDGSTLYLFGTYNKLFQEQKGISFSSLVNEQWSKPLKLKIPDLDIAGGFYGLYMHPSEKVLLISKGAEGNEDLYVSLRETGNQWSAPISLGSVINTSDFEISPFITQDQQHLFFSRGSQTGDTDIFYAKRLDQSWTNWSVPERLLAPINSTGFDAYFSMLPDSTIVFSSNREGSSDIYLAKLVLTDTATTKPIPTTRLQKENLPTTRLLNSIELESTARSYVFFDFNKSVISKLQQPALDQVVLHLKRNPELIIEIGGHTDYIDTEPFNQQLSNHRALAVAGYLISKGIDHDRLRPVGYGELLPVSNNEHPYGRSLNRRVEIRWLDIEGKTVALSARQTSETPEADGL